MNNDALVEAVYSLAKAAAKTSELLLAEQAKLNKLRKICEDVIEAEPGQNPWVIAMAAMEVECGYAEGE